MAKALIEYHNQEIHFYQLVASRFTGFTLPKLYGFEQSDAISGWHGRLLLSDLSHQASTTNAIHGLTIAQVNFNILVRYFLTLKILVLLSY